MEDQNKEKENKIQLTSLRAKAEEKLAHTVVPDAEPKEKSYYEDIIHELRVHQVELEMQSEELKRTQMALEESRDKYLELYDFAPVGYFSLTRRGIIIEANLTGAAMLGTERNKLIKRGFGHFVTQEALDGWDRYLRTVYESGMKQVCELLLILEDGSTFQAQLDSMRMDMSAVCLEDMQEQTDKNETFIIRTVLSDITERKKVEEEKKEHMDFLERFKTATIIREFRINELKDENKSLKNRLQEKEKEKPCSKLQGSTS